MTIFKCKAQWHWTDSHHCATIHLWKFLICSNWNSVLIKYPPAPGSDIKAKPTLDFCGSMTLTWLGPCSDLEALLISCLKRCWLPWCGGRVLLSLGSIQPSYERHPVPCELLPGRGQWALCPSNADWPFCVLHVLWMSVLPHRWYGVLCKLPGHLRWFLTPLHTAFISVEGQGNEPVVNQMAIICCWNRAACAEKDPTG